MAMRTSGFVFGNLPSGHYFLTLRWFHHDGYYQARVKLGSTGSSATHELSPQELRWRKSAVRFVPLADDLEGVLNR
jgi:hypothetical protein